MSRRPSVLRAGVAEGYRGLRDLILAGHLTPVIDSQYPLERVADAVALVKDGRSAGKVVVTVAA